MGSSWGRAIGGAVGAAPVALTALEVFGYVARVEGASMQPALNPECARPDYVFLSRWAARSYELSRGDVISLVSPRDPHQKIIKRVVALPGETVRTLGWRRAVVRVPEGHCWVEGDHTGHTLDSNSFGPVSLGLVTAKALCIVWPPNRWQLISTSLPERNPDRTAL